MLPQFSLKKKRDFPVKIFIATALANLLLATLLIIFFKAFIMSTKKSAGRSPSVASYSEDIKSGDPLLTMIPGLNDLITQPLVGSDDPSAGVVDAPIVIALFSDFQCSKCLKSMEASLKAVKEYPKKVKFVWKDFPEASIDSPTWKAALAGRCAAEQGDFFGYASALYSEKVPWEDSLFYALAGRIGLNEKNFKGCYLGREKSKFIVDNLTEAEALGISGVPAVYVNEKKITGEVRYEDLKMAIEEELNKQ